MAIQGSYQADTFAVGLDQEIRRLNAQVDLFWREERAALRRAGITDGMDVLDGGCGPGRLLELLAGEFDDLTLTGLEVDPTLVTAAKDRLAGVGLHDIAIVQGSIEAPNLSPASFDVVTLRLVLEHVVDPVIALRSLKRLLRPGGRIIVISNDFDFHLRTWPDVPELDDLYEAYIANRRADGGDPTIGRRLPDLLLKAGFTVAGFEIEAAHNHLDGDPAFQLAEGAGIPAQLVAAGYLDEATFEQLVASWRSMLQHPDHTIVRPLFISVGINADGDGTAATSAVARPVSAAPGVEYVAPTTDIERSIADIWAHVIGLERVGVTQNFFDLGGTSLQLEEIQVRLEDLTGRQLHLTALFQHPTVETLAAHLSGSMEPAASIGVPTPSPTGQPNAADESRVGDAVSSQARRRRDAMMRRQRTDG